MIFFLLFPILLPGVNLASWLQQKLKYSATKPWTALKKWRIKLERQNYIDFKQKQWRMWYLQAQYPHHKQEKSPFPWQPSTLLALFCSQIFTIFPMYGTGSPYLKQSVFSFFSNIFYFIFSFGVFPRVFTMSPTYSLCFWKAIQLCNWLKVETEDNVHVYL